MTQYDEFVRNLTFIFLNFTCLTVRNCVYTLSAYLQTLTADNFVILPKSLKPKTTYYLYMQDTVASQLEVLVKQQPLYHENLPDGKGQF